MECLPKVRESQQAEQHHHDSRWHGNDRCSTTGMLRPKEVEEADHEDRPAGPVFGMGKTQVEEGGEGADRGRDDVVSHK